MWVTGAANDDLSAMLGADAACCGVDGDNKGGCGKCLLLRNPTAVNSDWSAIMMKKNRCPPWSNGCGPGSRHIDIAVPGYDNLQYSTANICGASGTPISAAQSSICGSWYTRGGDTTKGCDCSAMPSATAEQRQLKKGCELFTKWGWTSGNPSLEFKVVECPAAFERIIGSAFGRSGVQPASSEVEADVQLPPPYQPLQSTIDNKEKVLKLTGSQVLLRLEPSLISLND